MKFHILSAMLVLMIGAVAMGDETYNQMRERQKAEIAAKNREASATSVAKKLSAKEKVKAKQKAKAKAKPRSPNNNPIIVPAFTF